MTQEVDGFVSLITILIRAAYAALVLGLGAIDAQAINHDFPPPCGNDNDRLERSGDRPFAVTACAAKQ